jgi:hypothetical protein
MRFPFFDSDARRVSRQVRQQYDDIITTLRSDPDIAAVATRLRLELLLADVARDDEEKRVRAMRAVRLEFIGDDQ